MPIILIKTQPYKKIEGLDLIDKVINIDQSPIGEHHVLILPPILKCLLKSEIIHHDFREHDAGL
jgi:hypothetical protein